jgi:phospholipid/cholesterol/gamma-HCH transport system substrate-binding protein
MLQKLVDAADVLDEAIPGEYASISLDLHLDGIQAGNLPALQGLLDLLGITAPIGDVLDALGLGDLLGGLGGLASRTTTDPNAPTDEGPSGRPGGGHGLAELLSLDGLLNGLTGGGN